MDATGSRVDDQNRHTQKSSSIKSNQVRIVEKIQSRKKLKLVESVLLA